ncbi:protein of unknown function [Paucidesulfovibrio gracilis DSM 16080]|uniref:Lipopolysaccharide-assembly n=1 Tax=Paucidesulfovibrio gracilis DSM 16080 TaxID=1121449 RepID=A0A1T4X1B3_9BACT|nr:DUF4136 domain-containing protein [Paucidesulfovibrio gracilis]SKA83346.1 protein of unknown function [Paucidesulfovibrio gracilis DSM 16080]
MFRKQWTALVPTILLFVSLAGCGYHLAANGPVALDQDQRSLFMERVDNPTLQTWLGPRLRSVLRDELTRRGWTRWTSRAQADLLVRVVIDRYSRSSKVRDADDDTLRYSASITMRVDMVSRATDTVVWSSGTIAESESYFGNSTTAADMEVTELAVRRAVDRLTQGY